MKAMNLVRLYRALGPIDLKNVRRDSMLVWLPLMPPFVALLARWGIPALTDWLQAQVGFDFTPYQPLIMSFFMPLPAGFVGVITGFLLLDERDDQTLTALMVTPMPLTGYLTYRLSMPLVASTLLALVTYPLVGLLPLPWLTLLLIALLSGFAAPLLALVLASLAANKVTGLALQKMLGTLLFLPVVAYFLPEPWQWLAGIFPTYWPMKLFWLAAAGQPYLLPLMIGILINSVYLVLFVRLFDRVMHR
jgi:fluoroquinolone transport system permease protein